MLETSLPINADLPPSAHFAGFWIRVASHLLDGLVILVVMAGLVALDVFLLKGDLGSFSYVETVDWTVVEERTETSENGAVTTFSKSIETRLDFQGRSAKFENEHTVTRDGIITLTKTSSRMLEADPGWGGKYVWYFQIGSYIALTAYFSLMWSSRYRSTVGGMVLRLRVTDYHGNRISLPRALGRVVAVVVSFASVIGYWMVAFTKRKQGLHDKIAKTLILRDLPAND